MSAKIKDAPLLGKSYLVALGIIVLICLPLIVIQNSSSWINNLRKKIMPKATPTVAKQVTDDLELAFGNMRTFLFEISEKDSALGELPEISREPEESPPPNANNGEKDPEKDIRYVWDMSINAITYEGAGKQGEWVAWLGNNRLAAGMEITMSNSPAGPCGYRILSVSRYCLWAWVILEEKDTKFKLPEIVWPDFQGVRLVQEGKVNKPVGLVMPDSRILPKNRSLRFTRTSSALSLDRLWMRGGEFTLRLSDNKPLGRLVCVIPAR